MIVEEESEFIGEKSTGAMLTVIMYPEEEVEYLIWLRYEVGSAL